MRYYLIVKYVEAVEIDASNEEHAVKILEGRIKEQNPKALFEIDVAEEVK